MAVESDTDEYDKFDSIDKDYRIKYVASHSNKNENSEGLYYTTEKLAKQDLDLIKRIINEDDIDLVGTFSFNNPVYYE